MFLSADVPSAAVRQLGLGVALTGWLRSYRTTVRVRPSTGCHASVASAAILTKVYLDESQERHDVHEGKYRVDA